MEVDENRLLERARRGDMPAYGVLFDRCRERVERTARRVFRSRDINDIVQETFVRGFESIATFRGDCAVSSWLCRIASNVCYDHFRQIDRKAEISLDDESFPEKLLGVVEPLYEPQGLSEEQEELVLRFGLSKLDEREALAIRLTWFDSEPRSAEEVMAMVGFADRQQVYDTTRKLIRICRKYANALLHSISVPQPAKRYP